MCVCIHLCADNSSRPTQAQIHRSNNLQGITASPSICPPCSVPQEGADTDCINRGPLPLGLQLASATEITEIKSKVIILLAPFLESCRGCTFSLTGSHLLQYGCLYRILLLGSGNWVFCFSLLVPCPFRFSNGINQLLSTIPCSPHSQIFGNNSFINKCFLNSLLLSRSYVFCFDRLSIHCHFPLCMTELTTFW